MCTKCIIDSSYCRQCQARRLKRRCVTGLVTLFLLLTGTWAYKAGLGKFLTKASFGQWTFEIWEQRKALKAAPCHREKILALETLLYRAGAFRNVIEESESFIKKCGEFTELREWRADAFLAIADREGAIKELTRLIELRPNEVKYVGQRGLIYQDLGQWESALVDFQRAMELRPGLTDIPNNLAIAYEQMNRPCDAAKTLHALLTKFPEATNKDDIFTKIQGLNEKGACSGIVKETAGKAVVLFPPGSQSIIATVKMKGKSEAQASFIIDTGASMVTITRAFADRLGVTGQRGHIFHTANGVVDGWVTTVDSIQLQGIKAKNVEVAIIDDAFGANDGLMLIGLNFLNRFKLEINNAKGQLTLTSRTSGLSAE